MRTLVLLLALLVITGCPGSGPCSSPSTLFPMPRASGAPTDGGVVVDVTWDSTTAPASFYASPQVTGGTLLDAGVTAAQVLGTPDGGSATFELRYFEGATRTCQHVGMDDTYVLSVTVPVFADGGVGTGSVDTTIDLGAL